MMAAERETSQAASTATAQGDSSRHVTVQVMDAVDAAAHVPTLADDANKYTRGVCDLLVGSDAFPGAAIMVAWAANRAGAGYVTAYTTDEAARALHVIQPSIVAKPLDTFLAADHDARPGHPRSVIIGSGMDAKHLDSRLLTGALESCACPVVIDGSALAYVASAEGRDALSARRERGLVTVVTPHGGEAARLARAARLEVPGTDGEPCGDQELAAYARRIADAYGAVCVLKGPDTFIAAPGIATAPSAVAAPGADAARGDATTPGPVAVPGASATEAATPQRVIKMAEGTAALAKAGTGDVLAGIMGAFLATAPEASSDVNRVADICATAAFVHARAGRVMAGKMGPMHVTPEDIIEGIPAAVRSLGEAWG